jgi:hypothetical protein
MTCFRFCYALLLAAPAVASAARISGDRGRTWGQQLMALRKAGRRANKNLRRSSV